MSKTELDEMIAESKRLDDLNHIQFPVFARTALPALVAEVERLRRVVDQAVEMAAIHALPEVDAEDDHGNPLYYPAGLACTHSNIRGTDEHPDLYAELKAREE